MLSQLGDIVGERVAALAPKADFSLGDVIDEVPWPRAPWREGMIDVPSVTSAVTVTA